MDVRAGYHDLPRKPKPHTYMYIQMSSAGLSPNPYHDPTSLEQQITSPPNQGPPKIVRHPCQRDPKGTRIWRTTYIAETPSRSASAVSQPYTPR